MVCFIKLLPLAGLIILGIYQDKKEKHIECRAYCRQYDDIINHKGYRPVDEYIAEERRKIK